MADDTKINLDICSGKINIVILLRTKMVDVLKQKKKKKNKSNEIFLY